MFFFKIFLAFSLIASTSAVAVAPSTDLELPSANPVVLDVANAVVRSRQAKTADVIHRATRTGAKRQTTSSTTCSMLAGKNFILSAPVNGVTYYVTLGGSPATNEYLLALSSTTAANAAIFQLVPSGTTCSIVASDGEIGNVDNGATSNQFWFNTAAQIAQYNYNLISCLISSSSVSGQLSCTVNGATNLCLNSNQVYIRTACLSSDTPIDVTATYQ